MSEKLTMMVNSRHTLKATDLWFRQTNIQLLQHQLNLDSTGKSFSIHVANLHRNLKVWKRALTNMVVYQTLTNQMSFPFAFPISFTVGAHVPHYILQRAASLLLLQVLAISSPGTCAQNSI